MEDFAIISLGGTVMSWDCRDLLGSCVKSEVVLNSSIPRLKDSFIGNVHVLDKMKDDDPLLVMCHRTTADRYTEPFFFYSVGECISTEGKFLTFKLLPRIFDERSRESWEKCYHVDPFELKSCGVECCRFNVFDKHGKYYKDNLVCSREGIILFGGLRKKDEWSNPTGEFQAIRIRFGEIDEVEGTFIDGIFSTKLDRQIKHLSFLGKSKTKVLVGTRDRADVFDLSKCMGNYEIPDVKVGSLKMKDELVSCASNNDGSLLCCVTKGSGCYFVDLYDAVKYCFLRRIDTSKERNLSWFEGFAINIISRFRCEIPSTVSLAVGPPKDYSWMNEKNQSGHFVLECSRDNGKKGVLASFRFDGEENSAYFDTSCGSSCGIFDTDLIPSVFVGEDFPVLRGGGDKGVTRLDIIYPVKKAKKNRQTIIVPWINGEFGIIDRKKIPERYKKVLVDSKEAEKEKRILQDKLEKEILEEKAKNQELMRKIRELQALQEKKQLKKCANCGKFESFACQFQGCSGCRKVIYCSVECQKVDWKTHKNVCKNV